MQLISPQICAKHENYKNNNNVNGNNTPSQAGGNGTAALNPPLVHVQPVLLNSFVAPCPPTMAALIPALITTSFRLYNNALLEPHLANTRALS